ncbi:hypothetical protein D018_4410B, partial [Vibrio parahaemolyticus VP2007-007]
QAYRSAPVRTQK